MQFSPQQAPRKWAPCQEPLWHPLVALADGHAVDDSLGSGVTPSGRSGGDTRMEGSRAPVSQFFPTVPFFFHLSDSFLKFIDLFH